MAILVNKNTRVVIQGITGREGQYHANALLNYGTNVVAGVTPGKGGEWIGNTPIFETVQNAVNATEANTSLIFVPPHSAADAIFEAIDAGISLIVCITEGIPILDMVQVREYIRYTPSRLIGPNCAGIISPRVSSVGIIPPEITLAGNVGIVARSGTLMFEVTYMLSQAGIGQSTIVGIGGDPIVGTTFTDVLNTFEEDPDTKHIILIGEIGGHLENKAAETIAQMTKPVIAYIAGQHLPHQIQFGHAGAIIDDEHTDAISKISILRQAGTRIVDRTEDIIDLIKNNVD